MKVRSKEAPIDFSLYSMVVEELIGELKEANQTDQEITDTTVSTSTGEGVFTHLLSDKREFFKHSLFAIVFGVIMIFVFKGYVGPSLF